MLDKWLPLETAAATRSKTSASQRGPPSSVPPSDGHYDNNHDNDNNNNSHNVLIIIVIITIMIMIIMIMIIIIVIMY